MTTKELTDTIDFIKEEILHNSVHWESSQSLIDDFEQAILNENKE